MSNDTFNENIIKDILMKEEVPEKPLPTLETIHKTNSRLAELKQEKATGMTEDIESITHITPKGMVMVLGFRDGIYNDYECSRLLVTEEAATVLICLHGRGTPGDYWLTTPIVEKNGDKAPEDGEELSKKSLFVEKPKKVDDKFVIFYKSHQNWMRLSAIITAKVKERNGKDVHIILDSCNSKHGITPEIIYEMIDLPREEKEALTKNLKVSAIPPGHLGGAGMGANPMEWQMHRKVDRNTGTRQLVGQVWRRNHELGKWKSLGVFGWDRQRNNREEKILERVEILQKGSASHFRGLADAMESPDFKETDCSSILGVRRRALRVLDRIGIKVGKSLDSKSRTVASAAFREQAIVEEEGLKGYYAHLAKELRELNIKTPPADFFAAYPRAFQMLQNPDAQLRRSNRIKGKKSKQIPAVCVKPPESDWQVKASAFFQKKSEREFSTEGKMKVSEKAVFARHQAPYADFLGRKRASLFGSFWSQKLHLDDLNFCLRHSDPTLFSEYMETFLNRLSNGNDRNGIGELGKLHWRYAVCEVVLKEVPNYAKARTWDVMKEYLRQGRPLSFGINKQIEAVLGKERPLEPAWIHQGLTAKEVNESASVAHRSAAQINDVVLDYGHRRGSVLQTQDLPPGLSSGDVCLKSILEDKAAECKAKFDPIDFPAKQRVTVENLRFLSSFSDDAFLRQYVSEQAKRHLFSSEYESVLGYKRVVDSTPPEFQARVWEAARRESLRSYHAEERVKEVLGEKPPETAGDVELLISKRWPPKIGRDSSNSPDFKSRSRNK